MDFPQDSIIADKYQVIKELGQGSFGAVYLVQHVDLGVYYAIKILKRNLLADDTFLDRFKREAEVLLKFTHPGSIQLRDFGRMPDGLYYMAMDYCAGVVLEEILLQNGSLPIGEALEIVIQLLSVLESAHLLGIIHRDIKSSNILIERDSSGAPIVRVLDFGIAKLRDDTSLGSKATSEGSSLGTPDYMSPEQASGESDLDHRVDIYASGVLMYEMLTGSLPFRSASIMQTLLKHLTQPVPPFPPELGLSNNLFDIICRAMAKERTARYQTAGEFRAECVQASHQFYGERRESFEQQKSQQLKSAQSQLEEQASGPRLLCLDDNPMILQIVKYIFEKEGYQVFTASSFSMIHDYVFIQHVPLMLCDVNLPGLPGPKICKMLKQSTKGLKIILFSNIDERDLEKLAITCRADGWISKNASPQTWLAKVQELTSENG